ncbi:MAG: transcription elongation GreA/GreB family factor [Candidatus Azotimanducaceae bacterium]
MEAAYLAHGQSMRAAECKQELDEFKSLSKLPLLPDLPIDLGVIVTLSFDKKRRNVFIGPGAAGLKVQIADFEIVVITPSSPLGKLLIGKYLYDEIELLVDGVKTQFEISQFY